MNSRLIIHSSDTKEQRSAKKSFKQKLKRQKKRQQVQLSSRKKRKRKRKSWKYEPKAITFSADIQKFIKANESKDIFISGSIELDEHFSLYEDPKKVFYTLLHILREAANYKEFVSLTLKNRISFGALYFIDTICWEIARTKKWGLKCNFQEREHAILTNLKSFHTNTSETEYAYIINNKIKINREKNALAQQIHKEKSKEIRDLINRGLKEENSSYDLSQSEHEAIDSAISEHFDNILLHVPDAEYGHLCGYFDKKNKEVTILIYNFGPTIAKTLDRQGLPEHVQIAVNQVVENHSRHAKISQDSFTKENALTLLAIQEGVSSKLDADISRGHGIIDFIEHCKQLNNATKIVIISGKTVIKVDSDYDIDTKPAFGRLRRILAFNKDNDIFQKPDSAKVINLAANFPGVLIETTIPLLPTK